MMMDYEAMDKVTDLARELKGNLYDILADDNALGNRGTALLYEKVYIIDKIYETIGMLNQLEGLGKEAEAIGVEVEED